MTTNQFLLDLTAKMPCKQINLPNPVYQWDEKVRDDTPYLQRYYAGTTKDNKDIWIHRFLSSDSERHLHSHPFECISIMLNGAYEEECISRETKEKFIRITTPGFPENYLEIVKMLTGYLHHGIYEARPKSTNFWADVDQRNTIGVFDWHRISFAAPETWTLLIVDPDRLPFWFFVDDDGQFKAEKSSPRDWWKKFCKRGDNPGDVS